MSEETDQAASRPKAPQSQKRINPNAILIIALSISVFLMLLGFLIVKQPVDSLARVLIVAFWVYLGLIAGSLGVSHRYLIHKNTPEKIHENILLKQVSIFALGLGPIVLAMGINYIVLRGFGISRIGILMEGAALIAGSLVFLDMLKYRDVKQEDRPKTSNEHILLLHVWNNHDDNGIRFQLW